MAVKRVTAIRTERKRPSRFNTRRPSTAVYQPSCTRRRPETMAKTAGRRKGVAFSPGDRIPRSRTSDGANLAWPLKRADL